MNVDSLKNLINEARRQQNRESLSLLSFLLGEYERNVMANNKVTVDQIVRKTIESNSICLAARADEKLEVENSFLKTLLPSYASVAELREHLGPLGLDKSGASVGKAIVYLRSNGIDFLPSDVKDALSEKD